MRSALAIVDVGPVLVDDVAHAGPRRADDVGAGQGIELAAAGQIADVDAVGAGRILHVDVPVVAAAVNVDVADDGLGGAGDVVAGDVEQAQDRLGPVPVLTEGGLGPLDALAGQFPVAVQPVGIAHHAHDAILAVTGGQIPGNLGGQILGGDADVVLAAFDLLFGGGGAVGIAGGGQLRDGGILPGFSRCLRFGSGALAAAGFGWGEGKRAAINSSLFMLLPPAMPFLAGQFHELLLGLSLQLLLWHTTRLRQRLVQ